MSEVGNPYFDHEDAAALLADLRASADGRTGDQLSAALRAVALRGGTLEPAVARAALAATALLVAERQPDVLDGVPDEDAVRAWLQDVDTELTPGRRLAAEAALDRIAVGEDNGWYAEHQRAGSVDRAIVDLQRLRDALTDAETI